MLEHGNVDLIVERETTDDLLKKNR
jgi:hypothetical protein